MRFKDYYDVLGVKPDASADEIKSAYRKLARKFHPDVSKEKNAEERFKDINEAFEALREPERRAAYDQARAGGFRAGDEFRPGGGGFEFDMGDLGGGGQFSDFFESLFGRARAGGPRRGARENPADTRAELEIDLETAYAGGKQRVSLQSPRGLRTLEVKIPKGIQSGKTIRLSGQGHIGADGTPGDLLLQVRIRPHPRFAVEGNDVTVQLPLSPWEAALGARVSVPTLGGAVEMAIPAGSQSGRKLRLKGRGMPSGSGVGDQYVVLQIHTPEAISDADRAAYETLRRHYAGYDPR
ncbi:MAG: DnaJ C-terminal domain-containing protein [Lysobacterales bacterium]